MKKLFISVPMNGRAKENIIASMAKMKAIAEATVGEELEVIDSYIETTPSNINFPAVWYLGESIKRMAYADYIIVTDDIYGECRGCEVESTVAHRYGIEVIRCSKMFVCQDLMPKTSNPEIVCGR